LRGRPETGSRLRTAHFRELADRATDGVLQTVAQALEAAHPRVLADLQVENPVDEDHAGEVDRRRPDRAHKRIDRRLESPVPVVAVEPHGSSSGPSPTRPP